MYHLNSSNKTKGIEDTSELLFKDKSQYNN